jgi:hypothetical protein
MIAYLARHKLKIDWIANRLLSSPEKLFSSKKKRKKGF